MRVYLVDNEQQANIRGNRFWLDDKYRIRFSEDVYKKIKGKEVIISYTYPPEDWIEIKGQLNNK